MKKKLLVLVAMLLCVVTVLASCASSMKFGKIVGDGTYNDENPTLTTSAKLDVKGEYSSALSKGDLAVFVDCIGDVVGFCAALNMRCAQNGLQDISEGFHFCYGVHGGKADSQSIAARSERAVCEWCAMQPRSCANAVIGKFFRNL